MILPEPTGLRASRPAPEPAPEPGAVDLASSEGSADDYGFDPALREEWLPAARFLFEKYWRVEVQGLGHVPASGGVLLIGNHSGALPFDAAMVAYAVSELSAAHRQARPL